MQTLSDLTVVTVIYYLLNEAHTSTTSVELQAMMYCHLSALNIPVLSGWTIAYPGGA